MTNRWQKRTDRDGVDYEVLPLPDYMWAIEIAPLGEGGRFWASRGGNGIGQADTLEEAKILAEQWIIGQVVELLKVAGAEGIWMVRTDAAYVALEWAHKKISLWDDVKPKIKLESPHERIMLVRFPAGDGGESGVEYL